MVAHAAMAQRIDFPEHHCYFDLPQRYAMPAFEDWSTAIAEHTTEEAMLNFEKLYLSSPEDATHGLSIAVGAPKSANVYVHDSSFTTAVIKAAGNSLVSSSKKTIDGFPVFEFISTDGEGTSTKNRVYGTEDRVYMVAMYYSDSSAISQGMVDSLLNSFHLSPDVKPATPHDPNARDAAWWIIRAVAAGGIGVGIARYRKRQKEAAASKTSAF